MPKKDRGKQYGVIRTLELKDIVPSPHQRRKIFNVGKLKELASSVQREGLIAPILVRRIGKRYELIAGERRVRAIRDHTDITTIQARIVVADDVEARRLSSAENALREDLTVFEAIEDIVGMIDSELIDEEEYVSMGDNSVDRVKTLLGKLDAVRRSVQGGYDVSDTAKATSHKFMGSVEKIFKNLPKPLEWRSFYNNDLNLLVQAPQEVRGGAPRGVDSA